MNKEELQIQLQYSKQELQQSDQKFGFLATVNAIIVAGIVTLMIYLLQNNNVSIAIALGSTMPFILLQLGSIIIMLSGLWPRNVENDSIFYYRNTIERFNEYNEEKYIKDMKATIVVNSFLVNKKYRHIKLALLLTFFPLALVMFSKGSAKQKTKD